MKFFSTINNVKAMEWGLQINQAYLFSWIYELPSWASSVIIGKDVYYYASKNKAVKELPLLTDKVDTMYRYYKQLENIGLITLKKIDGNDYILITQKGKQWYYNDKSNSNSDLNNELGFQSENDSDSNPTYKDIKDNKEYIFTQEENTLQVDISFDDFWDNYSSKLTDGNIARKKQAITAWNKLNSEEKQKAIDYACLVKKMDTPKDFVTSPDKLLNLKRFNERPHEHVTSVKPKEDLELFKYQSKSEVISLIIQSQFNLIKSYRAYIACCNELGNNPLTEKQFFDLK
jgi:hypothetical protein